MAGLFQHTCSLCGAVLSVPCESAQALCPQCRTLPMGSEPPSPAVTVADGERTVPLAESEETQIGRSGSDTEADALAMTVDYVPTEATAPGSRVSDGRPEETAKTIGRFRVISALGHGSFGTVFRAFDPLLDREVALKVPRFASDDAASQERFRREAKAAARLHHPNIVTLYENGQTEMGPYLVAEFVDGVPLAQVLRERSVDLRTAVDWVRQIAQALHYAHGEGVVHRDIKPTNIMMNRADRPQVMDFGLAKRVADEASGMTIEGQVLGTPAYMSPEQARGAVTEVGAHSDQYSVGVVLYEMLCGRPPFTGEPWSIMSRVANVHESPPPPRSVRPDIPRDLEACCLKALEKDRTARYPNLGALADDLDHWLKGLPLSARPIGPLERLVRWGRKNQLIASLSGTLATLIIAATIVGYWLAFRFQDLAAIAKRDAHNAQVAREEEKRARLATEQSIVDTYTETGLTADRNGDPREAILWFANAVAAAENHPLRERHNRIRIQSWLPQIAMPVQAFEQPAIWNKELSYHPSGNVLLSLSLHGHCDLLQVSDGQRLATPGSGPFTAAAWSPDGTSLVLASHLQVAVFQFPKNTELDRWNHPDAVNCLQWSEDGQLLVLGGEKIVQVRDVPKKAFRTGPLQIGSQADAVAITRDGRRFAVCSADKQVRVYSCAEDHPGSEPLLPPQPSAGDGYVSPMFVGNNRLVVVDNHQTVRCWDIDAQEIVWERKPKRVLSTAMSPDEKWIALGEDFDLVLLDAASGEPACPRITHPNMINGIGFHPQRPLLLTACVDHRARIFEVPSGKPVCPPIPHNSGVHRCVWSPDGTAFATVHWGGQLVRVWKPNEPQSDEFEAATSGRGPFVRFNETGDRWLPSGFDNWRDRTELEVLDAATGRAIGPKLSGPEGLISDADFIPRSPLVVLAGGGSFEDIRRGLAEQKLDEPGFVRFVNSETGKPAFADFATPSQPIAVRTSPDGRTVVVLCHRAQVLLFDAATGKPRAEHRAFGDAAATHGFVIRDRIRFSPRGDLFVIWGCHNAAEVRRTASGERVCELRHESSFIHDAQFSPDGRLIATGSSDHSVRLWEAGTGQSAGPVLHHSGWVFSVQFSRDGQRLLTASSDKQARIWDVATGTAVLATREHADQVFGVAFLPGEELFLASTRDGQLTAWDATYGKMIAPARRMPEMVYQLSRTDYGPQVLASGRLSQIRGFDWRRWILDPDAELSREDVRLLGEIVSSQRVHEGGAATSLTVEEWLDRWRRFREKHPDCPVFRMPLGVRR